MGNSTLESGGDFKKLTKHTYLGYSSRNTACQFHLFVFLHTSSDVTRGGAVLPQAVHRLPVHELDGADQTGAGAAVVLVAAWVAEVYVGTDETLLVAQQDHNLCRERAERRSVCGKVHTAFLPACTDRLT